MIVVAIYGCRNESDILELSLRHMLSEGIEHIYITDACSDDGSREILDGLATETGQLTVITDDNEYLHQAHWMNTLVAMAAADGAEWIVPSDVDEFWYATNGNTVADALRATTADKIYARMYLHFDWDTRALHPKPLPKVAFRWREDAVLSMGQHDVNIDGGVHDVLALREIQFRSFEHYLAKVRTQLERLAPDARVRGDGAHYLRLEGMTEDQLRSEWWMMCAVETVHDPIPSHLTL